MMLSASRPTRLGTSGPDSCGPRPMLPTLLRGARDQLVPLRAVSAPSQLQQIPVHQALFSLRKLSCLWCEANAHVPQLNHRRPSAHVPHDDVDRSRQRVGDFRELHIVCPRARNLQSDRCQLKVLWLRSLSAATHCACSLSFLLAGCGCRLQNGHGCHATACEVPQCSPAAPCSKNFAARAGILNMSVSCCLVATAKRQDRLLVLLPGRDYEGLSAPPVSLR